MSYGIRTWNANGVLEMDTDTFTYQVLHSQTYSLGPSQILTVLIAGFVPATCSAAILPVGVPAYPWASEAMPYVRVGNGVVTIRARNPSESDPIVTTRLTFRLLAMRYK